MLHRVQQSICLRLHGEGGIGILPEKRGELHLVPYLAGTENHIGIACHRHPPALLKKELGDIHCERRAEETLGAEFMAELKGEGVAIDHAAFVVGLHEFLAGGIAHCHLQRVGIIMRHGNAIAIHKRHKLCGFLTLIFRLGVKRKIIAPFNVIFQFCKALICGEVAVKALYGVEQVVGGIGEIMLTELVDVIAIGSADAVHREFSRMIFLVDEGIFEFTAVFPFSVVETVSHISSAKEIFGEIGSGKATHGKTQAFGGIIADKCIDGSEVEFALLSGAHISLYHQFHTLLQPIQHRYFTERRPHSVELCLGISERHHAMLLPEFPILVISLIDYKQVAHPVVVFLHVVALIVREIVVARHSREMQSLRAFYNLQFHHHIVEHLMRMA